MNKILAYNSVLYMTSLPINSIIMPPGTSFKIQEEIRHNVGPIIAADEQILIACRYISQ